ncbi:hypothetical protein [Nonomuraea sp. NPDC023979]|uniref:hypothetical protein n=1 Tax=Nonomuraea sp. NPDC023979 TaxID=3154796 RepID=UPI0033F339E4
MDEFGIYHGAHPAAASPNLTAVRWYPCASRTTNVRVRDYTCGCLPVVFELCNAAGLAFIRRHQRSTSGTVVTESGWETWSRTEALWSHILRGEAG